MLRLAKAVLIYYEHSLSKIWSLGAYLLWWSFLKVVVQAFLMVLTWRLDSAVDKMAL